MAHYVSADWELQKKVIGLRLIEVKQTGENIAERVACVVQECGRIYLCYIHLHSFLILELS